MKPLAIDLFCGLGGWTAGLIDAGYRVVGFDNERHVYGDERYPAQLVIQDVLTIDGRRFKDAALIVASPPCQEYSYRAMPWKRAKALPPPSNALFDACFRIQAEAIEAAGHFIPLVVENVRGAQPYVGKSRYHYGSFHLWGDIPALMPTPLNRRAVAKVGGIGSWSDHAKTGAVSPAFNGTAERRLKTEQPRKISPAWRQKHYDHTEKMAHSQDGTKQPGIAGPRDNGRGDRWFQGGAARHGSKSTARKRASAVIAKIPLMLSRHIGVAWLPVPDVGNGNLSPR